MDVILASDWEEKSEEWLIPSLLCDSLTLLSGEPKAGKTALACHLVRSLVLKTEILGKQPTQKKIKVAWMGFDFKWRREVKGRLPDLSESLYFLSTVDYKATDQWDELENIMLTKGINFLVIDHLYGLAAGADQDRQNQLQAVFVPIIKLIERTGASVLLLTQAPKGGSGRAAHSVASEGLARWLLRLKGSGQTKTLTSLGNNAETLSFTIKLSPSEISMKEKKSPSEQNAGKSANGGMPERAKYILDNAPMEAKLSVKALGVWLASQNQGVNEPGSGRSAINNLIAGGLLTRSGVKGPIVRGPKLLT